VVCVLGKRAYRAYAGLGPSARVEWGVQPRATVEGTIDFVAPNPSGRNAMPYSEQLRWMRELAVLAARVGEEPGRAPPQAGPPRRFRLIVCDIEGCIVPGDGRPWPLGDIGRLAELVARGIPVLGLARWHAEIGEGVEQAVVDLCDGAALAAWLGGHTLRSFLGGCDTALLVNNAGIVTPVWPAPSRWPRSRRPGAPNSTGCSSSG